jgi:lipopolysaccharide transport system ATP-binding protein
MPDTVISVEHLSKAYRLGQIGTGTLSHDLNVWWSRIRGRPSPLLKIGQKDHGDRDGETIWALKDVSFEVKQGEVLGIIGRNGAGKSTLLKIISQITAPTSGCVKARGRVASLLEVGTGFHPDLTGRENIYLNGAILGMNKVEIDRKFDDVADFAGVGEFIDTPVKRYSSGMYVRLAFAVATHLDPEILIIDEVLAVGDAEFQKKCLGRMGELAGHGRTVLFVSHNMGAISDLCQASLLLSRGRIAGTGWTADVVSQYLQSTRPRSACAETDLTQSVGNRTGEGPAKFVHFALTDISGRPTRRFNYGDSIVFQMKFSSRKGHSYIMAVSIRNRAGQVIYHITNTDDQTTVRAHSEFTAVRVILENNLLIDGDYYPTLWLGDEMDNLNDRVELPLSFEIRANETSFIRCQGAIRVKSKWSTA